MARPPATTANAPLVGTKLRAPAVVQGSRERSRLSTRLDAALEDRTRLTLLSAPPGYGKTVAVTGWLASRGLPHAWLSLDPPDDDLARFTRYLAAALRPVRAGAAEVMTGLFGPGTSPSPDLVGATLLETIAASDHPFTLVLDDYHTIGSEPIHRLVRILIEHGPPFVHAILLTREDPPLPLARLRAHRQLVELRADDLRYTTEEAAAYLADAELTLEPGLVGRLVERTEGWIAGLQLATISLRDRADPAAVVEAFGGSQRFVLDYLADEVLGRVDDALRTFLIQTSVAERFTAELCRELTGREDAGALLARAEETNLFVVALDAERRWYRYHHLFADYLRSRLTPDQRRELHERTADYFERHDLGAEAIEHALAADSVDRAARLIEREGRAAFESGELTTLGRWLEALPTARVATSAELIWLRAWVLFETGRLADAVATAESHLATAGARGPAEGRLIVLLALLATVTRLDAEQLAHEGFELLADDAYFRSLALQAAGFARLARGDYPAAVAAMRQAFELARQAGHAMAVLPAVNPLGHALILTGERVEAESLCRRVLARHADPEGRPMPIAWSARVVLGIARYEANDLAEASRELEAGFAAAAALGIGRPTLGWAVPQLALVRLACGAPEAALEALRISARDARVTGMALPGLAGETEARIRLRQGDLAAASAWAEGATPEAPTGSPLVELMRRSLEVTLARVRLAQGQPKEARVLLARTRAAHEAWGAVADLISDDVLSAAAAEAVGSRAEALRALEAAVRLAAPGRYVRRFVDDGASLARLLPLVRRAAPIFVDELIAAFAAEPAPAGSRSPHTRGPSVWQGPQGELLETLTARELEVLRLMAGGASNAAIASDLGVSLGTAKWHVGHVLAKLGATSRTQALVRAQQLGLV
jgi:LuxR family transcriptional regulator, maltose regulon positive regulatory protein